MGGLSEAAYTLATLLRRWDQCNEAERAWEVEQALRAAFSPDETLQGDLARELLTIHESERIDRDAVEAFTQKVWEGLWTA